MVCPALRLAAGLALLCLATACSSTRSTRQAGPWDLPSLEVPPAATWGGRTGLVQEVFYAGEPLAGQPTRVFAYLGRPEGSASAKRPGMILVHGGGGKAFKDWADHWARRGYVALAMDLAGNGPTGRLPDGGPDQSDAVKFREFGEADRREMWTYHAVAAVVRGHSLLRSLPEVDSRRTGITGISWGGYLTCIAAGIDSRFKVAVPVYGCGFLGDNSYWTTQSLAAMTPDSRALWLKLFDPSSYLADVKCPILFLNGTTDFAYPLDSYQKSYRLVPENLRHLSVVVNLPHGHIWTFPEVDVFVEAALNGGVPMPRLSASKVDAGQVTATVASPLPVTDAALCYTTDDGPWPKRTWKTSPARIEGDRISAALPAEPVRVLFLSATDSRGLRASSEHVALKDR